MNAQIVNYNCDGQGSGNCKGQVVKRLPMGGDGGLILCKAHYNSEIRWRKQRNKSLDESAKFDLPLWESLKVYTGA